MNVKLIDHVGIVVKDLGAALATYERNFDLNADASRGGEVPALAIKNAFVPIGGADLKFFFTDERRRTGREVRARAGRRYLHDVDRSR